MYPLLSSSCWENVRLRWESKQDVETDITQTRVNDPSHLGNAPFDNVAEMLVVYVIVLLAHRSLGAFFEFVLTVAKTGQNGDNDKGVRLTLARDGHSPEPPSTYSILLPGAPCERPNHHL